MEKFGVLIWLLAVVVVIGEGATTTKKPARFLAFAVAEEEVEPEIQPAAGPLTLRKATTTKGTTRKPATKKTTVRFIDRDGLYVRKED